MKHDRNGGKRTNWLLIKHRDEFARDANSDAAMIDEDASVASASQMSDIAAGKGRAPQAFHARFAQARARRCDLQSRICTDAEVASRAEVEESSQSTGIHRARVVQAGRATAERRRLGA
jgi:bifunctional non-homologous end joining protein LigD